MKPQAIKKSTTRIHSYLSKRIDWKRVIMFILPILFFSVTGYAQLDTINNHYFQELKRNLEQRATTKKVFLLNKQKSGDQLIQACYLKQKKKSGYVRVGKSFHYQAGRLVYTDYFDTISFIKSDTSFFFSDTVALLQIFDLPSERKIEVLDATTIGTLFRGCKEVWPDRYRGLVFGNGKMVRDFSFLHIAGFGYQNHGKWHTYDDQGVIIETERYHEGNLIPKLNYFPMHHGEICYQGEFEMDTSKMISRLLSWGTNKMNHNHQMFPLDSANSSGFCYMEMQEKDNITWISMTIKYKICLKVLHHKIHYTISEFTYNGNPLEEIYLGLFKTKNTELLLFEIDKDVKTHIRLIENHFKDESK